MTSVLNEGREFSIRYVIREAVRSSSGRLCKAEAPTESVDETAGAR